MSLIQIYTIHIHIDHHIRSLNTQINYEEHGCPSFLNPGQVV